MTVREEGDVTGLQRRGDPREHARRTRGDLLDGLAGRRARDHTLVEHRPRRISEVLADLGRGAPFVAAVVPLDEVGIGGRRQPRELSGPSGSLEW